MVWMNNTEYLEKTVRHAYFYHRVFLENTSRRGFLRLSRVLPTSRVFTSGYVNTETILHFFNIKIKTTGARVFANSTPVSVN